MHHSESNPHDSVDVMLFVNGIPVATAELKNQITRQGVKQAQTSTSGPQPERPAVPRPDARPLRRRPGPRLYDDPAGEGEDRWSCRSTRAPAARARRAAPGNPVNPDGYKTAYLWEQVWQRDAWLDMLGSFVSRGRRRRRRAPRSGRTSDDALPALPPVGRGPQTAPATQGLRTGHN